MSEEENDVTIEQLQADGVDLRERAKAVLGTLATTADVAKWLKGDLLPFIQNLVATVVDIDGTVEDLVTGAEEILHEGSAAVFAAVILGGRSLAAKVLELAPKDASGNLSDKALAKVIAEYAGACDAAEHLIEEITISDPGDESDEDENDEEDDDDESDDESDEDETDDEGDAP